MYLRYKMVITLTVCSKGKFDIYDVLVLVVISELSTNTHGEKLSVIKLVMLWRTLKAQVCIQFRRNKSTRFILVQDNFWKSPFIYFFTLKPNIAQHPWTVKIIDNECDSTVKWWHSLSWDKFWIKRRCSRRSWYVLFS